MNNESDRWNCESYLGSLINTPNNQDSLFPIWGHYSAVSSANLQSTISNSMVGMSNVTASAQGMPAMANDYYQHAPGSSRSWPSPRRRTPMQPRPMEISS